MRRTSSKTCGALLLGLAVAACGCGADSAGTQGSGAGGGGAGPDGFGFFGGDAVGGDLFGGGGNGGKGGGSDGAASSSSGAGSSDGSSGATDGSGGGNPGTSCEFEIAPLPGQPGATCVGNADCDSGVCVLGPGGKVCTRKCTDCCPAGYACEQWDKSDSEYICVPKMAALCRPCTTDAECAAVNPGALCIPYAAPGEDPAAGPWFCGGECSADADCPAGHACEQRKGESGEAKQCVNKDGACTCSPRAIADGAATWCATANAVGSCKGKRRCTPKGLGPCDAPTPAVESCDGLDDDCNGKTDDDIAPKACAISGQGGACKGKEVCEAGKTSCEAPTPGPEICDGFDNNCDGQTDEGFPDLDGDHLADCVDGDKDGDGTPDDKDCAPLDKAKAPNLPETCDGKDDDCDGHTDEEGAGGCTSYWQDLDHDGHGDAAQKKCLCQPDATHSSKLPDDCNDGNATAFPGHPEACDGADNDCNSQTDELWSLGKACADGSGACKVFGQVVCAADGKGAECSAKAGGGSGELCDGQDNDCDDQTDEGFDLGQGCWVGKGECRVQGVRVCAADAKSAICQAKVPGGVVEVCDGKDNDCDGQTDEGLTRPCSTSCGGGTRVCSQGQWGGCSAPKPTCSSGPCCDGCGFKPSSVQCGTHSEKTTYTCSGSCGGKVRKYSYYRMCSGKSSACSGALKARYAGYVETCSANQQCSASGGSYTCKTCSGGCSGSTCKSQPTHTVCIDPGYGGSEAGGVAAGTTVKAMNLAIGLKIRDWLSKDTANAKGGGNWKVVMTRSSDKTVSLASRVAICKNAGAERQLSVRVNAFSSSGAKGIETYYYSGAAKGFCLAVHNESVARSGGMSNRGLKYGNYYVLRNGVVGAACMTSPGFLTNPADAARIKSSSWRRNLALGYLHVIQKSFGYPAFTP